MADFRCNAKKFFLTFAQCPIKKEDLTEHYWSRFQYNLAWTVIAEEQHADGQPHLHVYIGFNKKMNFRNPNFFDVDNHHCNIQQVRDSEAVFRYVTKGKNYTYTLYPFH